ncbi:MAG: hypothetical protein K5669_08675 [Lachnospiraceae bacterium]|nr:hypothetical protein [Lachnospiraceae bacterium]
MDDKNLGNEWKSTAYNLGGAFVELGKTLMHSVKKGVDVAYDYLNEVDSKKKRENESEK